MGILEASVQFSLAGNPLSVTGHPDAWTYGYYPTRVPFSEGILARFGKASSNSGVDFWAAELGVSVAAKVARNSTQETLIRDGIPCAPGRLMLIPGRDGTASVLRWKASRTGAWGLSIQVQHVGDPDAELEVALLRGRGSEDRRVLQSGSVSGARAFLQWSVDLAMAKGDFCEVAVRIKGAATTEGLAAADVDLDVQLTGDGESAAKSLHWKRQVTFTPTADDEARNGTVSRLPEGSGAIARLSSIVEQFPCFNDPNIPVPVPGLIFRADGIRNGNLTPVDGIHLGPSTLSVGSLQFIQPEGEFRYSRSRRMDRAAPLTVLDLLDQITTQPLQPEQVAMFSFDSTVMSSLEQASLDLGFSARYLTNSITASFRQSREEARSAVMASLENPYYTAVLMPEDRGWPFAEELSFEQLRALGNSLAYVRSVTFGRRMYLVVTLERYEARLRATVNGVFGIGRFGGSLQVGVEEAAILNNARIQAVVIGGPSGQGMELITKDPGSDVATFIREHVNPFLRSGATFSPTSPGAPVSYTMHWLGSNRLARVAFTTDFDPEMPPAPDRRGNRIRLRFFTSGKPRQAWVDWEASFNGEVIAKQRDLGSGVVWPSGTIDVAEWYQDLPTPIAPADAGRLEIRVVGSPACSPMQCDVMLKLLDGSEVRLFPWQKDFGPGQRAVFSPRPW